MRVDLVGQCVTLALQVLDAQLLNLLILFPLQGVEQGDIAYQGVQQTHHDELEDKDAQKSVVVLSQVGNHHINQKSNEGDQ